jgi:NAD(P)-dependent dehydrogenase (short-subunit alcohol dehydrogenase family)
MEQTEPIAVVTGAGSGLGRSIALALAETGWTVVLAGRREGPLKDTAALIDGRMVALPADVTNPESVRALFAEIDRRFGRVDLLVNNAGIFPTAAAPDELTFDQWKSCVDTNLTGAFLCAQAAFRMMRTQQPQGGRIINNGSISAHSPRPHSIAYTATKHAITGLTKSLSLDGRPYNIACGQIDIGNAATDMTEAMNHGVPQADGSMRPEPTFDAHHVAAAIQYMAGLPLEANVQFLTVMATAMPFIGRG